MKNNRRMSRRSLLQGAGAAMAAAMLPARVGAAEEFAGPVMTKLSAYMAEARGRVQDRKES